MELMRGLAFIALLFAGSAVGAELRQAEVCGDGTTHQAGYCPAVLSSASCSATGATTGSCSAASDETDGTRYVCATSNTTALTGAEIEACSGGAAIAGATPAPETGSNSIAISGLTTDAAHYGQIVNKSPEQWYSNRLVSSSFTPSSGGELWDLWGARSQPSELSGLTWPTQPTPAGSDSVSSLSALNSAIAGGNTEVTLASGSYSGNVVVGAVSNVIINLTGATITGNLTLSSSAQTIRINGGRFNSQADLTWGGTDITFNNVYYNNSPGFYELTVERATRWALLSSTFHWDGGRGMILRQPTGSTYVPSDFIVAGTNFDNVNPSSGWSLRINVCNRFVSVDSRYIADGPAMTLRVHNTDGSRAPEAVGYYMARNQVEHADANSGSFVNPDGSTGFTSGDMRGVYVLDNSYYDLGVSTTTIPLHIGGSTDGLMVDVYVQDNTAYSNRNGGSGSMVIGGNQGNITNYNASNNVLAPVTSPPSFAYGSNQ